MPTKVCGSTSQYVEKKVETSLFAREPYLRTTFIESNIEEDIDKKNHYKSEKLLKPTNCQETASKTYVDDKYNEPSIFKNSTHADFNVKTFDKNRFV